MPVYLSPPPRGPLSQIVTAIVVVLVIAAGLMLGLAALAVIAGLGLVLGLVAWVRAWYLRRKNPGVTPLDPAGPAFHTREKSTKGQTIEAEYTVVSSQTPDSKEN